MTMPDILILIGLVLVLMVLVALTLFIQSRLRALKETKDDTRETRDTVKAIRTTLAEDMALLHTGIGEMKQISADLKGETKEVRDFFEVLRGSSQKAGRFGEFVLEDIVKRLIPESYRKFQCPIHGGERVDCAVLVGDRWVPVDAKFPVSSLEEPGGDIRKVTRKKIDEVSKYIAPERETHDFALMFVPSDGLYSAIVSDSSIVNYALDKKVMPVSPSTLYAYLATVALGIERIETARDVDRVIDAIKAMKRDIASIGGFVDKASNQIGNAESNLESAKSTLSSLQVRLDSVGHEVEDGGVDNGKGGA